MTKKTEGRGSRPIRIFGIILPALPAILFRFGRVFLKFKIEAKKGGRIFHKELMRQGIDKKTATELTEKYLDGSNLSKYLFQYIR